MEIKSITLREPTKEKPGLVVEFTDEQGVHPYWIEKLASLNE